MSALDLTRLYRAHVTPQEWRRPECTVFVEAFSHAAAIRKIATAVAALEYGSTVESVSERIYNVSSAAECIHQGLSADPLRRIFETAWSGNEAIGFVTHPLFLLEDASALIRIWVEIPQRTSEAILSEGI
jgi:hypothetical protein